MKAINKSGDCQHLVCITNRTVETPTSATLTAAISAEVMQVPVREGQLHRAQAVLELVKIDLERTTIRSPYAGRIAKVLVAVGDRTFTGSAVVELYDTGALEIRTQVPGQYLAQLRTALAEKNSIEAVITTVEEPIGLYLDRLSGKVNRGSSGVDALFRLSLDSV